MLFAGIVNKPSATFILIVLRGKKKNAVLSSLTELGKQIWYHENNLDKEIILLRFNSCY